MLTVFLVDSLEDTIADDGATTLREAIQAANTNTELWGGAVPAGSATETDVIRFAESLFTDGEDPVPGTITLGGTQLSISGKLDIEGPGADLLSINANQLSRVFSIGSGVEATLSGLTITGGTASTGGAISNAGILTVTNSRISGNSATGTSGQGGGIYSTGSASKLTLLNSTISGNTAVQHSGGIFNSGSLTVANSTISGNSATSSSALGGGIASSGTVFVINSTISANSSGQHGGGIYSSGSSSKLTLVNSTVTANSAAGQGGGVYLNTFSTAPILHNSVIAANTGSGNTQVQGTVSSDSSHNFIGYSAGLSGIAHGVNGNQIGTDATIDPMLGPLQDNGGQTWTHAPLPGSPLIDAGSDAKALDAKGNPLVADQRGFARLYGIVDIGAVESQPPGIPVAYDDAFVGDQDGSITLDVLSNDFCNDGGPMTTVVVTSPAHGVLEENSDGTWTYTPEPSFWGVDMFSYRAVNGELLSNTAQVFVSVLSPTSIIVTTADDEMDGNLSPDDMSLREALAMAGPGSTIQFSAAMLNQVIKLAYSTTATLAIADVQIIGPGASFLTVDGNSRGAVFRATSGETRISHLTVTGGSDSGIIVDEGVLFSLEHAVIRGNRSNMFGGGIRNASGTVTIANSTVSDNSAGLSTQGSGGGGAISSISGTLNVINSVISGNAVIGAAFVRGGAIYSYSGVLNIANSIISGNNVHPTSGSSGSAVGGGIYSGSGTASITDSMISHNTVTEGMSYNRGGGIYSITGSLHVDNSIVSDNSANEQGGGIYAWGSTSITNSVVARNTSNDRGGGIVAYADGTFSVTNSLIVGNSARAGGGIVAWPVGSYTMTLNITNSTIAGNSATQSSGGLSCPDSPDVVTLTNSIVAVNAAPSYPDVSGSIAAESSHNLIGGDPGFVRNPSPGVDGVWGTADDDFGDLRLRIDSPAVNAGSNALAVDAQGNPLTVDLDGNPRISGPRVDIGAYEYQFPRLPGDADWSGVVDAEDAKILAANWGKTGKTWADGDFNGDGRVDAIDAAILAAHFGATLTPPGEETPSVSETPIAPLQSVETPVEAVVADARPFVGPLPVGGVVAVRQPIQAVERLGEPRLELWTQQRAYALRSPVLHSPVLRSPDVELSDVWFEQTDLTCQQLAWAHSLARRQASRADERLLDQTALAVDLLLAQR